jgi:glutamine synthetase
MITVEYIWLDGAEDMPQLRAKVRTFKDKTALQHLPDWSFDGGSTGQGDLEDSDRTLHPVRVYDNPFSEGNYLALCEVMNPDGTPHESNSRADLRAYVEDAKEIGALFGFEQEYTFTDPGMQPLVPEDIVQGNFYCGNGAGNVIGRLIVNEHLELCEKAGIRLFGANAEVMISQWEYQTNPEEAIKASDDLWMSRFILERHSEKYNMRISYHPKIYKELNGAGCHVNVSTDQTREEGGLENLEPIMDKLKETHIEHINVYGVGNDLRLTGECETSDYDTFSWGVGNRGASVRIPTQVSLTGKGYFEDRRPAATCDPYLVTQRLLETLS